MGMGVADLAEAMVAALRWRNADPVLRNYHAAKLAGLRGALGADPDADARSLDRPGGRSLRYLLDATVAMLAADRSPFAGFLEAPREVVALYQRHGKAINAAGGALNDTLTELLKDLIVEIYKIPLTRTATDETLRQHGFDPYDPEPDPLDYW
jgi:hypothetical protein